MAFQSRAVKSNGQEFKFHLQRLKMATVDKHSLADIPRWIKENTYLHSKPYSFVNHEFQERIALDQSQEVNIMKCSQVGLSELAARMALALVNVQRGYTVAYTLPTATFAESFMATRIDPIIAGSPFLKSAISDMNNTSVKRFGDSFLYMRGSQSSNAPISIPCDHLIHDELDFSDPNVVAQYHSRLTHSKFRRKHHFSTPTFEGVGIHKKFQQSRRFHNFVKCNHCNHYFKPDYFQHVRIPHMPTSLQLRDINRKNLHKLQFLDTYLECPKCGKEPSLQIEHREWVLENPDEGYMPAGYHVQPFDAPNIISLAYLVQSSTTYKSYADFENNNLGVTAEGSNETLERKDLDKAIVPRVESARSGTYVMGIDMGATCHVVIGRVTDMGLVIVHVEQVRSENIRVRRRELWREYRVRLTVVDSLPYTETVLAMQLEDHNLYGAFYTETKGLESFRVKDQDEEKDSGRQEVRQVNIARTISFDALMIAIQSGFITKMHDDSDDVWIDQCLDMRRGSVMSLSGEMVYKWIKSDKANDHYHHATNYMYVASQMIGLVVNTIQVSSLIGSFGGKTVQK